MEKTPQSYWLNYGEKPAVYYFRGYDVNTKEIHLFNCLDVVDAYSKWTELWISRFTGYYDTYGQQIFFGDIIEVKFGLMVVRFVVDCDNERGVFVVVNKDIVDAGFYNDAFKSSYPPLHYVIGKHDFIKVIGNIYTGVNINFKEKI